MEISGRSGRGESIIEGPEIPLDIGKVVIKLSSPVSLKLYLRDWEEEGLRIDFSVGGEDELKYLGGFWQGHFNEQPYPDKEIAMKAYQHVLEQVQKGKYSLELNENQQLKLLLTNPKL